MWIDFEWDWKFCWNGIVLTESESQVQEGPVAKAGRSLQINVTRLKGEWYFSSNYRIRLAFSSVAGRSPLSLVDIGSLKGNFRRLDSVRLAGTDDASSHQKSLGH